MFCPNCGQQIPDGSIFCPVCGAGLQAQTYQAPVNLENRYAPGFSSVLRSALASSKFLAICILESIVAVMSFIPVTTVNVTTQTTQSSVNFNIMVILCCIAMWITYANAKGSETVMPVNGLKFSSGIATANWIFMWIGSVFMVVFGVLFTCFVPMYNSIFSDAELTNEFMYQLETALSAYGMEEFMEFFTVELMSALMIVLAAAFVIAGIVMIVFTIFYYGKLRKFARNLHVSYMTNRENDLRYSTIATWLMVIGILTVINGALSVVGSPVAAVSSVIRGAAVIVASTWVRGLGEDTAFTKVQNTYNM